MWKPEWVVANTVPVICEQAVLAYHTMGDWYGW